MQGKVERNPWKTDEHQEDFFKTRHQTNNCGYGKTQSTKKKVDQDEQRQEKEDTGDASQLLRGRSAAGEYHCSFT